MGKHSILTSEWSEPKEKVLHRVLGNQITLNEDISPFNFYCAWFQLIICAFIFTSVDFLQTILLTDTFQVPQDEIGGMIAKIQVADYSFKLLNAMVFGFIVDKFGRRVVYYYSIMCIAGGYILIPFQTEIFPGYLLVKLMLSQGVIALQMLPLTADYVHDSTKGKAASLNYTLGFVGALIAAFIFFLMNVLEASIQEIYWVFGFSILIFGNLLGIGVKGGTEYYRKQQEAQQLENGPVGSSWSDVYQSFKTIPWLKVILLISVLGNADLYVMSTGIPVLVKSMMVDQDEANIQCGIYLVIFFTLSFICTLCYGRLMDKLPHLKLLLPLMIIATFGFYAIPFVSNAHSPLLYAFMVFEGATLPGVFAFGTFLGTLYSPAIQRGRIGGIATSLGVIGALVMFVGGGYLHDYWRTDAPFIIYAGLITLCTIWVGILAFRLRKETTSHEKLESLIEKNISYFREAELSTAAEL
jgi:MFS family permease